MATDTTLPSDLAPNGQKDTLWTGVLRLLREIGESTLFKPNPAQK